MRQAEGGRHQGSESRQKSAMQAITKAVRNESSKTVTPAGALAKASTRRIRRKLANTLPA